MIRRLSAFAANPRVVQSGVLYVSLLLQLAFGILISVLNTRLLGPEHFGNFKYLQSVFTITLSCLTLGVFVTSGNLLAVEEDRNARKFLGGALPIVGLVAVAFVAVVLVFLLFSRFVYSYDLFPFAKLCIPFLIALPLQIFFETILRGGNNIYRLALMNCCPQILNTLLILGLWRTGQYTLNLALVTYLGSVLAVGLAVLWSMKPSFTDTVGYTKTITRSNRRIGFPIYLGVIITYITSNLGNITLGYFLSPVQVGEFALAMTISMPLALIPNVIATTFFKDFATLPGIPLRLTWATIGLTLASLLGFSLIIRPVFAYVYGPEYAHVLTFVDFVALGCAIHGLADFVSRYLLANNQSRPLFIVSSAAGLISVLGYVGLVYAVGLAGAVATKIAASTMYLAGSVYFYRRRSRARSNASVLAEACSA